MPQQFDPFEPIPDHLADTGPMRPVEPLPDHLADTGPIRPVRDRSVSGWRRVVGFISLIGAVGLTVATALLLLSANSTPTPNPIGQQPPTAQPTGLVQVTVPTNQPQTNPVVQPNGIPGTLSPNVIVALLTTPIAPVGQGNGLEIIRNDYNPFTVIPDRPRSDVIQYQVQAGDTIFSIAQRYGLKPETIAWSNDRAIVEGLRPGQELNILPIDGAYFTVVSNQSITSIAKQFNVDPFVIIDSEYNNLFGDSPDTQLPSNTKVVVPGGEAEAINWNPPVQHIPSKSGSSSSAPGSTGEEISFDIDDSGSCGLVVNPGGSGSWRRPLAADTWVRGFSSIHSGIDLADPIGTPIMAATSGRVVFSGWSTWGYGESVVVASGPFTEIYGHMSAIAPGARCGSLVSPGTILGAVGDTGNATGPHLHFEIRYNDSPIDPTTIGSFG